MSDWPPVCPHCGKQVEIAGDYLDQFEAADDAKAAGPLLHAACAKQYASDRTVQRLGSSSTTNAKWGLSRATDALPLRGRSGSRSQASAEARWPAYRKCNDLSVTYPRAWIAQDFAGPEWDGVGQPPEPWDGTGEMPPFEKARGYIAPSPYATGDMGEWDTVEEAISWARERVDVVLVRIGYSDYYSAGIFHPVGARGKWPPSEAAIRHETRRG